MSSIVVRGAREHNLKNIDVSLDPGRNARILLSIRLSNAHDFLQINAFDVDESRIESGTIYKKLKNF